MISVFYNKNDTYKSVLQVGIIEMWVQVLALIYANYLIREVTQPFWTYFLITKLRMTFVLYTMSFSLEVKEMNIELYIYFYIINWSSYILINFTQEHQ